MKISSPKHSILGWELMGTYISLIYNAKWFILSNAFDIAYNVSIRLPPKELTPPWPGIHRHPITVGDGRLPQRTEDARRLLRFRTTGRCQIKPPKAVRLLWVAHYLLSCPAESPLRYCFDCPWGCGFFVSSDCTNNGWCMLGRQNFGWRNTDSIWQMNFGWSEWSLQEQATCSNPYRVKSWTPDTLDQLIRTKWSTHWSPQTQRLTHTRKVPTL